MLYYNRIKGCHKDTTSSSSGNFTYIIFMDGGNSKNMTSNPTILINNKDSESGIVNNGHILTSDMENGYINKDFTFNHICNFYKYFETGDGTLWSVKGRDGSPDFELKATNNNFASFQDRQNDGNNSHIDFAHTSLDVISQKLYMSFRKEGSNIVRNNFNESFYGTDNDVPMFIGLVDTSNNYRGFTIFKNSGNYYTFFNTIIKTTNKCEALYFNTTSDIRAKENIKPATFNAVEIVKSLPIQTFNYVDSKAPSIGVIAQDAAKIDLGTAFNLVDNLNATGENGDFMTVKETKLVYILWKALQEQSKMIEQLQKQVANLEEELY